MIRRLCLIGPVAVLLVVSWLAAQDDDKDKPKKPTPAEEYRAITKDYDSARTAYIRAMQAATTDEERQAAREKLPNPQEFAPRFLALAKKYSKEPVAFDSLLWIAQNAGFGPVGDEAIGLLTSDHLENPRLASLFQRQGVAISPALEKLAREIVEKSPDKAAKSRACLALAMHYSSRGQADQAEQFFQRIMDEFADVESLMQIVQNAPSRPIGERAIARLIADFGNTPAFNAAIQRASTSRSPGMEKLFRAVLEKAEDRDAKGHAAFALAQWLKTLAEIAEALRGADDSRIKEYETYYGADTVTMARQSDATAVNREVEKLLERVVEEYSDVKAARGTLGDAAEPDLFEIRFLSVGKSAPDIEAEDLDGQSFKLSDYRGKVLMLDFWGHW